MIPLEELTTSEIAYRLGWALIHSLWQGVLAAAVLGTGLLLLPVTKANRRYLLGCMCLFGLVVSVAMTAFVMDPSAPLHAAVEATVVSTQNSTSVTSASLADEGSALVPAAAESLRASGQPSHSLPAETAATGELQRKPGSSPFDGKAAARFQVVWKTTVVDQIRLLLPWASMAWFFGAIFIATWHLGGWVAMQRLKATGTGPMSEEIALVADRLSRRMRVKRPIRVLQSAILRMPVVIGHFKPVILMPVSVMTGLPIEQIEAIIAHELAHIRRWDYVVSLCQSVVETLFFHHPAVWWISRQVRIEREYCCDDVALRTLQSRSDYARALTALCESRTESPRLAVASDGGILLERIRRIADMSHRTQRTPLHWGAAASLIILCVVAVGAAQVRTKEDVPGETVRADFDFSAVEQADRAGAEGRPTTQDLTEGLVAWYKLDGNAQDASGNGNHGRLNRNPTYMADRLGEASGGLDIASRWDNVLVQDSPSLKLGSSLTLAAWIKPKSLHIARIVNKWEGQPGGLGAAYNLGTDNGKEIWFELCDNAGESNAVIARVNPSDFVNKWHHIAGVYDGSRMRLFIDGEMVGSGRYSATPSQADIPLYIGTGDGEAYTFNGAIDDIRIYDRTLDDAEIRALAGSTD